MKTKVLGIGNTILRDDGAGIYAVRKASEKNKDPDVSFEEAMVAGFNLLDLLQGTDRLILVDTITTKGGMPGEIYILSPEDFTSTTHSNCVHQVDFFTALELGRKMGMKMPDDIRIIAIEAKEIYEFGEECTPEVTEGINRAAKMIEKMVGGSENERD